MRQIRTAGFIRNSSNGLYLQLFRNSLTFFAIRCALTLRRSVLRWLGLSSRDIDSSFVALLTCVTDVIFLESSTSKQTAQSSLSSSIDIRSALLYAFFGEGQAQAVLLSAHILYSLLQFCVDFAGKRTALTNTTVVLIAFASRSHSRAALRQTPKRGASVVGCASLLPLASQHTPDGIIGH